MANSIKARVLLRDNVVPSKEYIVAAQSLGRQIIACVNDRPEIIANKNIDSAFALPDANWGVNAANDYIAAFRLISSLEWSELQYLRLRAQPFTGFSLLYMSNGGGRHCTDPVPHDFDVSRVPFEIDSELSERWHRLTAGMPKQLWISPKPMLGEVGWISGATLVNADTVTYQERMALLYQSGLFDILSRISKPRILEIGGGYGALAGCIGQAFPYADYTICDLPESLLFSGLYTCLTNAAPTAFRDEGFEFKPGINLMPNFYFEDFVRSAGHVDLVINTLSLSEMSNHQISTYASGISTLVGSDGLFFEQNVDNRHIGFADCKELLVPHFKSRRRIETTLPITTGTADVWSNLY